MLYFFILGTCMWALGYTIQCAKYRILDWLIKIPRKLYLHQNGYIIFAALQSPILIQKER